jgi:hypothetical protein
MDKTQPEIFSECLKIGKWGEYQDFEDSITNLENEIKKIKEQIVKKKMEYFNDRMNYCIMNCNGNG